jgi:hypothetical protein
MMLTTTNKRVAVECSSAAGTASLERDKYFKRRRICEKDFILAAEVAVPQAGGGRNLPWLAKPGFWGAAQPFFASLRCNVADRGGVERRKLAAP